MVADPTSPATGPRGRPKAAKSAQQTRTTDAPMHDHNPQPALPPRTARSSRRFLTAV